MHFIADGGKPLAASLEFPLGKAQVEVTGLLELNIDAGFALKSRRQRGPLPGGVPGPAGIVGNAATLAVHPDQAEVSARSAKHIVAFVQDRDVLAELAQPTGHCRADQAAADHDHVAQEHVCALVPFIAMLQMQTVACQARARNPRPCPMLSR